MPIELNKLMRATACAAAMLLAAAAPSAFANTVYDNLGSSPDGSDPLLSYGPLADSFNTGADGGLLLGSITALLKSGSDAVVGDVQVSLHADSGNGPGALLLSLGSLSSAVISTLDFGRYVFNPGTAFQLAANTTYWVEIEAASPNAVEWAWSGNLLATGVAGQSNYSSVLGLSSNSSAAPYQMAVAVQAVPEPASLALMFAGLGLTALVAASRRRTRPQD